MPELKVGKKAPLFTLTNKDGEAITPSFESAELSVIFFYPKDDTPGCTIEAKEFSGALASFSARGISVIGISGGSDKTKASFCKKHSLKVSLLSDPDFKVAKTYGAFGPKKFMGRSYEGIFRKTFVIDRAGKIVHIFDSVKPEGHAQEVLALLSQLKKSTSPRASAVKKPAPPRKVSAKTSKNKKVSAPKKKGSKRG